MRGIRFLASHAQNVRTRRQGQVLRRQLLASGEEATLKAFPERLQPVSLIALLATLVLLFGS
jgi:ACR3 family arsenite efflux pump ArsB